MGLQVWLPLNGSLENRGLSNTTLGGTYSPTYIDGKIGKCMNCSTTVKLTPSTPMKSTKYSFAAWIKSATVTSSSTVWWKIFRMNYSDSTYHTLYTADSGSGRYKMEYNPEYNVYCDTQVWQHLVFTIDGAKITAYLNGTLVGSSTGSNAERTLSSIEVGGNANVWLNDVRVYDHILSPKEVKEISKALCLHYTLNNNGMGQENLVAGSATFDGWTIASGWTKAQDTDGTTYIKFSRTGATANNWVRAIPSVKLTPSDYPNGITVSFDFKVTDLSALNHKCVVSLQTYKSDGTRVGWVEPNNTTFTNYDRIVNGQWVRIAKYFTQTDLLRVSQTGYTTADISYTMISFQLVQNGEIFIRKVKAEAGNTMSVWSPNSADTFYNSTEFDTSGYRNNATPIDTTIKHLVGSPRYDTYTKFDGNTSGLKIENTAQISPVLNNGIFTISFWAKHDVSSNREIYFGNFDAAADFNLERTAGNVLRFYWNNSPDLTMSGTTISDANWHHIVVIRNGSSIKAYIDGVLKYDGTATIASLTFDGSFRLGRDTRTGTTAFGGGMSDFRLYATALSEADIKELYNAPAAVDNDGNMYAMQLVEVI